MSVVEKLNTIKSYKEDIKQAIADKGVDMTDVAFAEYAVKISEIPTGVDSVDYVELKNNITTYTDKNITSIDDYLFAKCPQLTTINFPNCTYIGEKSFSKCMKLSSINIPNTREIIFGAFQDCEALTSIDLPECKEIQSECFRNCKKIQSISLPKCDYLNYSVFEGCDLLSIDLPKLWKMEDAVFRYNPNLQTVNLPICQRIQGDAFSENELLTSVSVPHCFHMLGGTFRNCSSLTELDLSKTYTCYLEDAWGAFENTPMMEGNGSIYIHAAHLSHFQEDTNWSMYSDNFVAVGDPNKPLLAFEDGRMYGDTEEIENNFTDFLGISRNDLTSIDLPNVSRLYINRWSEGIKFNGCYNLQEVNLPSVKSISQDMFKYLDSLTSINLPMCETIGSSVFDGCSSLTSINLPMCKSIGSFAFCNCSSLTSINLPMCEKIYDNVFIGCIKLKTITVGTSLSTVCEVDSGFDYSNLEAIYVPSALVEQYKAAPNWSNYADKIFGI